MRHILILLAAFSIAARAEDWTTTDGTTYQNVKVLSHDAAFVTIMDADGGARIPLRLLSPELQSRFGYDAKKAAALEAATTAQDHSERTAIAAQQQAALARQQSASAQTSAAPAVPTPVTTWTTAPPFDGGVLANGDFLHGTSSWEGDGETARAYAQSSPRGRADPNMLRGLVVPLNPQSWTRVYQTFQDDKGTVYSIVVTFKISTNFAPSKDPADYTDISKRLDIQGFEKYSSIGVSPGDFYGTVGDPDSGHIACEVFAPQTKTDVQTYEHTYPAVSALGTKTFALAFPPGTGAVDIVSVKVTSK